MAAPKTQEEAALPDAPSASLQQQSDPTNSNSTSSARVNPNAETPLNEGGQTKRILFLIPNFRAVSTDKHLPAQTVKEKFITATFDSVDYSSFIFVAIQAGIGQARNSSPEFRQGAAGFARYYWHTYADFADENLWVEFILPTALHQDSRYYTLGRGSFPKRLAYSFSRVAITRTDSGHETFNASEIFGAGAAAGISGLYYPSKERTFTKGLSTMDDKHFDRCRLLHLQGVLARYQQQIPPSERLTLDTRKGTASIRLRHAFSRSVQLHAAARQKASALRGRCVRTLHNRTGKYGEY
jgi:hypothetical protein